MRAKQTSVNGKWQKTKYNKNPAEQLSFSSPLLSQRLQVGFLL